MGYRNKKYWFNYSLRWYEYHKIGNHDKRVKEATEAVLKNKSVYNALKRLTDDYSERWKQ